MLPCRLTEEIMEMLVTLDTILLSIQILEEIQVLYCIGKIQVAERLLFPAEFISG